MRYLAAKAAIQKTGPGLNSVHPEMANLPDIGVARKN
jgi:hypothetical protein